MTKQFKPNNYNSASPYIMVDDARRFIEMLAHIFGAVEKRRYNKPDGKIMHAEVQLDDSIIMIADSTAEYPTYPLWMHVYVPDAQSTYDKAVAYGCEAIEAPVQKENDDDLRGTFKDFAGNFWAIGTQL